MTTTAEKPGGNSSVFDEGGNSIPVTAGNDKNSSFESACHRAQTYYNHGTFNGLVALTPMITIPTILCSLALIRQIRSKFRNHPIPNALLISASSGAILANAGFLSFWLVHLVSMGLRRPCLATITNLQCNLAALTLTIGIATFNVSVFTIGFERAYLTWAVARQVRLTELANAVQDIVFASGSGGNQNNNPEKRTRDQSTSSNVPKFVADGIEHGTPRCAAAIVAGIWGLFSVTAVFRITYLQRKDRYLPVCSLIDVRAEYFAVMTAVLAAGNLGSFCLTIWTKVSCKRQLQDFALSQTHISLNSRVALRYTIRISEMMHPSLLFASVWQFIASGNMFGFFLVYHQGLSETVYALLQHYQTLLLSFPPMLICISICFIQRRNFDLHGASLFVRLNEISTEPVSGAANHSSSTRQLVPISTSMKNSWRAKMIKLSSIGGGYNNKSRFPAGSGSTAGEQQEQKAGGSSSNGETRTNRIEMTEFRRVRNGEAAGTSRIKPPRIKKTKIPGSSGGPSMDVFVIKDVVKKKELALTKAGEIRFSRLENEWERKAETRELTAALTTFPKTATTKSPSLAPSKPLPLGPLVANHHQSSSLTSKFPAPSYPPPPSTSTTTTTPVVAAADRFTRPFTKISFTN